eukprot:4343289-Pleurochrysis_carterae.AAC.1
MIGQEGEEGANVQANVEVDGLSANVEVDGYRRGGEWKNLIRAWRAYEEGGEGTAQERAGSREAGSGLRKRLNVGERRR